ncbi:hypothetical protein CcCBS67573_g01537 [Chytriomyces confervae]|uniref:Uncharacterized protein n=1 Tax=Chytriomyces confervae TaxID=246404 RepID=A0A507FNZ4_9FUNG|nr:hypothetical protein CcCBS67573_g01537 [Chytriomyces confervae]
MYEVKLKEVFDEFPQSPHKTRVRESFNMLEEIIPCLGNLAPIVTILKDEIHRSVYSRNLTSSETEPFVERVPFFCAAGRVDEARQEEAEKANESLAELQQRIRFRDYDIQILYKKNMKLKEDISDYQVKIQQLNDKIKSLEDQCHKQEIEKGEATYYHNSKEDTLKREIEKLQATLTQKNNIIEKLTVFKSAYNDSTDSSFEDREKNKMELIIDSIGMVEYDIYQAERLQEQFAEILNYQLDDFEMALSQLRKKKEILQGVVINETEREASYALEFHELVAAFRKRISDLLEEQRLLKAHTKSLQQIYDNYASDTKSIQRTADGALKIYSSVLQFSDDACETFKTYKKFAYCGKCGDHTAICPHKLGNMDPIPIKPHSTHLRLIRPGLKLRTSCKIGEKPPNIESAFHNEESEDDIGENEDEQLMVTKTMKMAWLEYYNFRQGYKPKFTRTFNLGRALDYIQEIYEARWAYEDKVDENANFDDECSYMKFSDFFYDFFNQRYQIQEVALKAIHDLFTAISKFETENHNVALFIRHLCGLEDVTWKYIYDARKLFAKYNDGTPFSPTKYRQILNILYPSRPRELNEQMELEYTAFSKNKYTLEMVEEHLMHMIFKQIEPNVKFFTLCLKRYDYQETGVLQFEDFDEALTTCIPFAQAKHKRLMYRLAEQHSAHDQVPIPRLAMIASYLMIHESSLHSWLPQIINAPEVVAQLGRMVDTAGKDSDKSGSGGGRGGFSGGLGAGGDGLTQDDVDVILKTDNIHGINLDARAVEEEEKRMKMRVDMAMAAQADRS